MVDHYERLLKEIKKQENYCHDCQDMHEFMHGEYEHAALLLDALPDYLYDKLKVSNDGCNIQFVLDEDDYYLYIWKCPYENTSLEGEILGAKYKRYKLKRLEDLSAEPFFLDLEEYNKNV